jgi:potassium-dependent mechanosensitive channel
MWGALIRAFLVLAFLASATLAQVVNDGVVETQQTFAATARAKLDGILARLQNEERVEGLVTLRGELSELQSGLSISKTELATPLGAIRAQLDQLGPAPSDGATENSAVAAQRKRLTSRAGLLSDIQKQLDLVSFESNQALTRIADKERARFYNRIFSRERSILNPSLWVDLFAGAAAVFGSIGVLLETWWRTRGGLGNIGALLLIPVIATALWLGLRILRARYFMSSKPEEDHHQATTLGRLTRVFWRLLAIVITCLGLTLLILVTAEAAGVLTPQLQVLIEALALVISAFAFHFGLAWLVASPRHPELRLIAVDDHAARLLPITMGLAAFAASLGHAGERISKFVNLPVSFTAGQSAISTLILLCAIGLSLVIIRNQAKADLASRGTYFLDWFVRLIPIVWGLLVIGAIALIVGYLSFGYFIADNILTSTVILLIAALVHYLVDAVADAANQPTHFIGNFLGRRLGLSEAGVHRTSLVFRTVVDILIVLVAVPMLLSSWTSSWVSLSTLYQGFSNGFTFGSIRLSPWSLLLGAIVISVGVALTRIITNWLNSRVLTETALDKGVQDSVRTAASYAGYIIAGALGLSVAGLDFSNIAIVAGALGVGIGFGLQSIVNNFVSGLILLAERPVRVGDWVVTTAGEGVVKTINVRSTEIETFDNCTVIVPNSNLITEPVRNWTHRDSVGRFGVALTVAPHTTQLDEVIEIMTEAARAHPKVLRYPEPVTQLAKFTEHGLAFELKGHVADVFTGGLVASDLRLVIAKEFAARKIQLATISQVKQVKA